MRVGFAALIVLILWTSYADSKEEIEPGETIYVSSGPACTSYEDALSSKEAIKERIRQSKATSDIFVGLKATKALVPRCPLFAERTMILFTVEEIVEKEVFEKDHRVYRLFILRGHEPRSRDTIFFTPWIELFPGS